MCSASSSPCVGEELRQDVASVDADRADPRQVVEADLVDGDAVGFDPEHAGDRTLEADGDVAQADGAVAGVEERARDDADGIREVDDPRAGRRTLGDPLGDLEHDGNGAHRLREAAGAGRLLADAPARKRDRLVAQARGLAADADLEEDEVGSVDRAVEVAGAHELAARSSGARACAPRARRRRRAARRRRRAARTRPRGGG